MKHLQDHQIIPMILLKLGSDHPVPPIPEAAVDAALQQFRVVYPDVTDEHVPVLAKIIKSQVKVTMEEGVTLHAADHEKWLDDKAGTIQWKRWGPYKQMLMQKGFAPNVMARLDNSTAEIVDCLGDPTVPGAWKRRGLVIGDVQSGKTATYLGVVNRAADVGYKLIVLLAGGTEALRKQTQYRVDEGLFGRDTANANKVFGAGKWHGPALVGGQPMTTQMSDFRKKSKEANGIVIDPEASTPLVFVLKKNKTALENVRDWINEQRLAGAPLDVPMLVVDDESDYASVNTKAEDDPTRINELIREILGTTSKSSYLAFTATPFANVFIDHETSDEALGDDLFPRDYIRTLEAPSNYVGSAAYFGTEDAQDDAKLMYPEDASAYFPLKHKSQHYVPGLPPSLVEAIRTFVVASAVREHRQDFNPRSMLVNVSRFKAVQARVHALVEEVFVQIRNAVELHGTGHVGEAENAEIAALRKTFQSQYGQLGLGWETVAKYLGAAVHGVNVRLVNSDQVKKADDLREIESDRMIAVGGDVLSRGLTLDGLTVSYFHRQAGAADTLLQMARWFGYRPGYEDLCRVWILPEVADHFRYVHSVVEELRAQIHVMKKQDLTPQDFGLRVRMHPEALLITARNKMKAAEAKAWIINVAGARNLETVQVSSELADIRNNVDAARRLVVAVEKECPGVTWDAGLGAIRGAVDVPREVIAEFLSEYVGFAGDAIFADSALSAFVKNGPEKYASWTVAFVPGKGTTIDMGHGLSFPAPTRGVLAGEQQTKGGKPRTFFRMSGEKSRLAGSNDVARAGGVVGDVTEPSVYEVLTQPVLLLYPLKVHAKQIKTHDNTYVDHPPTQAAISKLEEAVPQADFVLGVKVGIPGTLGDASANVKYMLNSVALTNWAGAMLDELVDDLTTVDGGDDD